MHSVPVAVLTAAEWRRDCRPKGTAAAPFPAIDIHYSGSTEPPPPTPPGTQTLYVLISVGNKDFLLS